jgi:hypothetical protein
MEGIVFMKIKYKEAGMKFKCFHNRGCPERWPPRDPSDFNAPERVAVLSDEIAERVGIYITEPQEVPYPRKEEMDCIAHRGRDCQTTKTTD